MAETFEKILVKDDRLGCITPKVKFQVLKGGRNVTCQPFKAISETKASHVYNVTVPSLETILSREALLAVDSDAEDHHYRQGCRRLCRELRRH